MNASTITDVTPIETAEAATAQPLPVQPQGALVSTTPAELLRIAVEKGVDFAHLEKLMDLRDRWEAREAKRAYDAAFAAFKAEAITIIKGRGRTDGPLRGSKYAELHDIVDAVTPALSKHGLSSSWKLTKDDRDWMEVTCYLRHVAGHEESVSMGGPPDTGPARNAIQARASTKTYLERYTLKAITGLAEQGDDDDGAGGAPDDKKRSAQRQQPADRATQDAATPAFYEQKRFDANKAAWRKLVLSGSKTTAAMIRFIESKGAPLTVDQKNTIDSWTHEND